MRALVQQVSGPGVEKAHKRCLHQKEQVVQSRYTDALIISRVHSRDGVACKCIRRETGSKIADEDEG